MFACARWRSHSLFHTPLDNRRLQHAKPPIRCEWGLAFVHCALQCIVLQARYKTCRLLSVSLSLPMHNRICHLMIILHHIFQHSPNFKSLPNKIATASILLATANVTTGPYYGFQLRHTNITFKVGAETFALTPPSLVKPSGIFHRFVFLSIIFFEH